MIKYITFPTKRAYGIELELSSRGITKKDIANAISAVDKLREVQITGWEYSDENDYWHVKEDSSCGWEVASYKSKGVKDLANIAKVTDAVAVAGGFITQKCGFHLHVEAVDFTKSQMATLVAIWMKIEKIIINAVPSHRVNNKYCRLLNDFYQKYRNKDLTEGPLQFWHGIKPNLSDNYDYQRRVALNIWNYAEDAGRRTVEFRFPEGTLDSKDVKNWIRLLVRMVDFCKNQPFPESTSEVKLSKALRLMGLVGSTDFFILSPGLRETKEWFLYRLLKYSHTKKLCRDAINELNNMWAPIKIYELSPDCEAFSESTGNV